MIDISTVTYEVELLTEDGTRYQLNDALIGLQWEEQISELAQRATVTVANFKIGDTFLMELAKIGCFLYIYSKWNGGNRQLVFEGMIWEWQYVSETQKELTVTAYDLLKRLQESKDFKYYSAGMTTQALIEDICNEWEISIVYSWEQSMTHEKKAFSVKTISDMVIELLEEVREKTGQKYVIGLRDGQMQITGYGTNSDVYLFDSKCVISTRNKLDINNLVTRVKVIGKQDDEGRAPIEAVVDGDLQYGVLQDILRRDNDKTLEAVTDEANTVLKEKGKPEELIELNTVDVPFMRKGDKVEVAAGNLLGKFFVEGVTHQATNRKMKLTLQRSSEG